MKIDNDVHLIRNGFVNTYLVINDRDLLLIDTGLPHFAPTILAYIKSLGFQESNLKQILLTHSDGDHVGSAEELRNRTGATLLTSAKEAAALEQGKASRDLNPKGVAKVFYRVISPLFSIHPLKIDQKLADLESFPFLGGLKVIDTPGHTPGHLSFYSPSTGFLFCGDSIRIIGSTTSSSTGANTWNPEIAEQSYKLQMYLNPKFICAGHGFLQI